MFTSTTVLSTLFSKLFPFSDPYLDSSDLIVYLIIATSCITCTEQITCIIDN
ncbi:hypothetical protein PHET_10385 [Paragonimus heterotremus]|uniref:Uncharacterized protein n=1 Tax=Paragonimus heterotremus TaxID=100268 RepID=A0A8J4T1P1_9TREM|nr:hypothetical protein PHET_10385 [Paragonimus heterotremus]